MWQQIDNLTGALGWQAREDVFQIGVWIVPVHARSLDQAHDCCRPFTAA